MESQIATSLVGQKWLLTISVTASIKKGVPSWSHPCEVAVQNGKSLKGSNISYLRSIGSNFEQERANWEEIINKGV